MLRGVGQAVCGRAREKNLDFQINVSPDLPAELVGDEIRIKQILINVLNNAIKYTKAGSVSLSIQSGETRDGMLNVIYTVSDTGIGIKKESIPYLFTAFKRVDEEKNRQEKTAFLHVKDSFKKMILVKDEKPVCSDEYGIKTMNIYDFLLNENSLEL